MALWARRYVCHYLLAPSLSTVIEFGIWVLHPSWVQHAVLSLWKWGQLLPKPMPRGELAHTLHISQESLTLFDPYLLVDGWRLNLSFKVSFPLQLLGGDEKGCYYSRVTKLIVHHKYDRLYSAVLLCFPLPQRFLYWCDGGFISLLTVFNWTWIILSSFCHNFSP